MQDEQVIAGNEPTKTPESDSAAVAEAVASQDSGLEEALKQAQLAAEEHHDAWLRAKAEADNARKRAQTDIANAHKFAVESFASGLPAVKDSLEAALAVENASIESLRAGTELTLKQLVTVFEKFNLTEINPIGEKFDPHRHQAMSAIDSDEPVNTVLSVMQKGYALHDRIIRPALVVVAKAKAS